MRFYRTLNAMRIDRRSAFRQRTSNYMNRLWRYKVSPLTMPPRHLHLCHCLLFGNRHVIDASLEEEFDRLSIAIEEEFDPIEEEFPPHLPCPLPEAG